MSNLKKLAMGLLIGLLVGTTVNVGATSGIKKVEAVDATSAIVLPDQREPYMIPSLVYQDYTYVKLRDLASVTNQTVEYKNGMIVMFKQN